MNTTMNISISSGTLIRIITSVLLLCALFYVRDFVVALLVAIVLASAVEMPVEKMVKWGIPRTLSVSSLFLGLLVVIAAIIFIFIPPLAEDIARFVKILPQILQSFTSFGLPSSLTSFTNTLTQLSHTMSQEQVMAILKSSLSASGSFFATTGALLNSVLNFLLTFVLAFYLALEEHGVRKFLHLIVPRHHEEYVTDLWSRSQRKIGFWMQGQLLLSLLVSILVYIPMLILGMPYATLLALLAFFGELVPMVGLTLATIPALIIAFAHGGVSMLGIVALIYFIIGQLENHVLYPKVMNKMVGVPSVVVIIALVIGAKLAGIWGVLLAVPLASILMELADDVHKRKSHVA